MPISEYIVKQRNEGLVLAKKIGAVCAYILLFALLCFLILALSPELFYIPFFLMSAALVAVVVFVTWRFLCKEFEIVIGNGEMRISTIYARSLTRRLVDQLNSNGNIYVEYNPETNPLNRCFIYGDIIQVS